ncbi:MAG: MerR family transcriptional regulator [Chloroflexi bacterium]|nr:MAG: MerR family transcriptional regulator [Chloroflexota bacterium]
MSSGVYLSDFPATPLYNIKAVVQATGISPSTLRAWERRYQVCQPQRTESGYRLYSDRDVAMIRWLKDQVDAGMAISQAVSWLDTLAEEANGLENVVLPRANGSQLSSLQTSVSRLPDVRGSNELSRDLLNALTHFNELAAEQVLTEAFALYPLEYVGEQIIVPALVEIGERWHRGEASVTVEHYATNFLLQRLSVILQSVNNPQRGALIWVACAPAEQHEIGSLLLVIYLRRAGYRARYIGKDIPIADFVLAVEREQPALILLSACTTEASSELARLAATLAQIEPHPPIIGYGGRIFCEQPELRNNISGVYMGDSAYEAVIQTNRLLLTDRNDF